MVLINSINKFSSTKPLKFGFIMEIGTILYL
jgi:hypothetical protein